jgi:hypothetical protein
VPAAGRTIWCPANPIQAYWDAVAPSEELLDKDGGFLRRYLERVRYTFPAATLYRAAFTDTLHSSPSCKVLKSIEEKKEIHRRDIRMPFHENCRYCMKKK